jgi:putative Mn2+ efflux pump MntP
MMIWQLVALGAALGLNNALASVALGTMKMSRWLQLRTALLFAVFEAGMPLLGMVVGENVAALIGGDAKYIGIAILVLAGLYSLIKRGDGEDDPAQAAKRLGWKTFLLAAALSLDNLTVGFALGMLNLPMGLAAVVFGAMSLVMTLVGLEIGRFLGSRMSISSDKLSGAVLLITAAVMVLQ